MRATPMRCRKTTPNYAKKIDGRLKKLKVGFVLRFGDHPIDIEVAAMVTKAAREFERLGCKVEEAHGRPSPMPMPAAPSSFIG